MADSKNSSKKLVVVAPLVAVKDAAGRTHHLYRGASLDGVPDSEVERLIGLDMVGEDKDNLVVPGVAAHPDNK